MMNTNFGNMAFGKHTSQVNVVQKPPYWCQMCCGSDHTTHICSANPDSLNFVGNAQSRGGQQNYRNCYNPRW